MRTIVLFIIWVSILFAGIFISDHITIVEKPKTKLNVQQLKETGMPALVITNNPYIPESRFQDLLQKNQKLKRELADKKEFH